MPFVHVVNHFPGVRNTVVASGVGSGNNHPLAVHVQQLRCSPWRPRDVREMAQARGGTVWRQALVSGVQMRSQKQVQPAPIHATAKKVLGEQRARERTTFATGSQWI